MDGKKNLIAALALGLVLVVVIIIFFYWRNKTAPAEPKDLNSAPSEAKVGAAVAPPSTNPVESVMPSENPVEKTNPFKYENPFK